MKKINIIIAVLFSSIFFNQEIFATDNFEAIFPRDCQSDVTTAPLIKLRAAYPIDTNSITKLEYGINDTNFIGTNAILIRKDIYDNMPDSLYGVLGENIQVGIADTFDLYILGKRFLSHNTEYTLILKDNIKLLKPNDLDPNQIDTLTERQTFECLFKTKDYPLSVLGTSINKYGLVGCEDTIKIFFNKKIDLTSYQLNKLITIEKEGEMVNLDSNNHYFDIDTITFSVVLSSDSLSLKVKPTSVKENARHFLNVNFGIIDGLNNPPIQFEFNNYSNTPIKITTIPKDTSITLTDDIRDINGPGERLLQIGDTLQSIVPLISGDLVFEKWIGIEGRKNIIANANSLTIIGHCSDMNPYKIAAIYKKIPVDTLNLLNITNSTTGAIHTCSNYIVNGFQDSLSPFLYTYKRFADKSLFITMNLCNGYDNATWYSTDSIVNGSVDNVIRLTRNGFKEWAFENISTNKEITVGGKVFDFNNANCDKSEFEIEIQFVIEKDFEDEFIAENIKNAFTSFTFNGANILNDFINYGSNNRFARQFVSINEFPKSANYSFVLNDQYAVRIIHHRHRIDTDNPNIKEYGQYEFPKFALFNGGKISVTQNNFECSNQLTIIITRNPTKVTYEIIEKDSKEVPSIEMAHVKLSPAPTSFMNKPLVANNYGNQNKYMPEQTFISDELVKQKVSVLYPNNTSVTTTRYVKDKTGYVNYKWGEQSGYTYPTPSTTIFQTFTTTLTAPKVMEMVLSSTFRLQQIWTQEGNVKITDYDYIKHHYSSDMTDGENTGNLPVWANILANHIGDGMRTVGNNLYSDYKSDLHIHVPTIVLRFSEQVLIGSLLNNLVATDLGNELESGTSITKNTRKDSVYLFKTYNTNNKININDDFYNIYTPNGRDIYFDLQTSVDDAPQSYFMHHRNNFELHLRNNLLNNADPSHKIMSYKVVNGNLVSEQLANISTQPNKYKTFKRRTTFPSLKINLNKLKLCECKVKVFEPGPFNGTIDTYTYVNYLVNNNMTNENKDGVQSNGELYKYTFGDDGSLKMATSAMRVPSSTESFFEYEHNTNINIIDLPQISNSRVSLFNHFVDYDGGKSQENTQNALIDLVAEAVKIYINQKSNSSNNDQNNSSAKIKDSDLDKIKEIVKTFMKGAINDDEYMNLTQLNLTESSSELNWQTNMYTQLNTNGLPIWWSVGDFHKIIQHTNVPNRWKNWGAGPYGLYNDKFVYRESFDPELKLYKDTQTGLSFNVGINWIAFTQYKIVLGDN